MKKFQINYLEKLTELIAKLPDEVIFELDALDYLVQNILNDSFEWIKYEAYPACLTLAEIISHRAAPNKFTDTKWLRLEKMCPKRFCKSAKKQKKSNCFDTNKKEICFFF